MNRAVSEWSSLLLFLFLFQHWPGQSRSLKFGLHIARMFRLWQRMKTSLWTVCYVTFVGDHYRTSFLTRWGAMETLVNDHRGVGWGGGGV